MKHVSASCTRRRWTIVTVLTSLLSNRFVVAFVPSTTTHRNHHYNVNANPINNNIADKATTTVLRGISEWRDTIFDIPGEGRSIGVDNGGIPRQVCVLPFPYDDVLLQGETKQLRLYEERFIKLFDYVMDEHNGVVGMGLIAETGIIQTVPLCEVEAYNRMEGFGIFVTIRVVGRAALLELSQQEPFIKATCLEIADNIPPNLDLPNMVASNIENFYITLSSLDAKLELKQALADSLDEVTDENMRRRIMEAQLEDKYYDDVDTNEIMSGLNDDADYDSEDLDRNGQFNAAFLQAKASDSQGYMVSKGTSNEGSRSAQDLTAISWSAFCTDDVDDMVRIQALDCDDLFDRLKMGSYMLREKKAELEAKLALSDVQVLDEDEDD